MVGFNFIEQSIINKRALYIISREKIPIVCDESTVGDNALGNLFIMHQSTACQKCSTQSKTIFRLP